MRVEMIEIIEYVKPLFNPNLHQLINRLYQELYWRTFQNHPCHYNKSHGWISLPKIQNRPELMLTELTSVSMKPHFPWSNVKQENEWFWQRKGLTLKSDCIDVVLPRHYGSLFLFFQIWKMPSIYWLRREKRRPTATPLPAFSTTSVARKGTS